MVCRVMPNDGDSKHPTCSQTLSHSPGDFYNSPVNTLKSLDAPYLLMRRRSWNPRPEGAQHRMGC